MRSLFVLLLLVGCRAPVCEPGATQACVCAGGEGAQVCSEAADSWGPCDCGEPGDDDDSHDDDDAVGDDDDTVLDNTDPSQWPDTLGGDRTARVKWPSNYDGGALPLVLQLHGYTGNGQWQWQWPNLEDHLDDLGFVLISGEGTTDPAGDRFWNATDACCDFYGSGVDDVAWLTSVLDEAIEHFPIDTDHVYVTGLSNGGFMSYRMACELSERVAAIASVAGMDFVADDACIPAQAVSVLHIHGTDDQTVAYNGWPGNDFNIPSARESVTRWAERAGCDVSEVTEGDARDYVEDIAGAETTPESWETGCENGRTAALWTMDDAPHVPAFSDNLGRDLLEWLFAHEL